MIPDSLSATDIVGYIEAHPLVAIIALVILIAVLVILAKIARWVILPVLKGAIAGGLVYLGLMFLDIKDILNLGQRWTLLIAVLIFLITAVADLNRKK